MVIVPGLEPPNGDTRSHDSPVVCTVNGVGYPLSTTGNVVDAGLPSVEFSVIEAGTDRQVRSLHFVRAGSVAAIVALVRAIWVCANTRHLLSVLCRNQKHLCSILPCKSDELRNPVFREGLYDVAESANPSNALFPHHHFRDSVFALDRPHRSPLDCGGFH